MPAIRTDLRAGDLGRIIELHGKVYDLLIGCTAVALRERNRGQLRGQLRWVVVELGLK